VFTKDTAQRTGHDQQLKGGNVNDNWIDNYFEKKWWKPKQKSIIKYGDTDSFMINVKADHYFGRDIQKIDTTKLVFTIRKYGSRIQNRYLEVLKNITPTIDQQYNLMNAKLEVISLGITLFAKKNYIVFPKVFDEGTVYEIVDYMELFNTNTKEFKKRLKTKGGAFIKKDTSEITKEFLSEVYEYIMLVLSGSITYDRWIAYDKLMEIMKKYTAKINKHIERQEFDKICQTKKYPYNELKTVPKHQLAMKLYNTIVEDVLRDSDSAYILDCLIPYKELPTDNSSSFKLNDEDKNHKLTQIAIPTKEPNLKLLETKMKEFNIVPDVKSILEFHLTKKLDVFKPFFKGQI